MDPDVNAPGTTPFHALLIDRPHRHDRDADDPLPPAAPPLAILDLADGYDSTTPATAIHQPPMDPARSSSSPPPPPTSSSPSTCRWLGSVEALTRTQSWWCLDEVADQIHAYLDHSPRWGLSAAIRCGHVHLVQRLLVGLPWATTPSGESTARAAHAAHIHKALEVAATHGHREVIQWLVVHQPQWIGRARLVDHAAAGGHLDLVQWLNDHPGLIPASTEAMDLAAGNGFLEVVHWLHGHSPHGGCTTRAMDLAATHGHLQVVQWLHHNRSEGATTAAMDGAAARGHLQMVRFLHQHRHEGATAAALDGAAQGGFLAVVRFLCEQGRARPGPRTLAHAADGGHLPVVQYIWTQFEDHAGLASAITYAGWRGHADIVQYLIERRWPLTVDGAGPTGGESPRRCSTARDVIAAAISAEDDESRSAILPTRRQRHVMEWLHELYGGGLGVERDSLT